MARLAQIADDGETVINVFEGDPSDFPNAIDGTDTSVSKWWAYDSSNGAFQERWFAEIDADGVVTDIDRGTPSLFPERKEVTGSRAKVGWTDNGDGTYSPPTAPPKTWNSTLEFLREFTRQERIGIRKAAAQDDVVEDFLFMLQQAASVRADNADVTEGMQYLVDQGHITSARRDEILGL